MLQQASASTTGTPQKENGKSRRGFASMNKDRHKLVSSKGGKAIRARQEPGTPGSNEQQRTYPA